MSPGPTRGFDPKDYPLLAELREEDVDALDEHLEFKKLAKGRKLFREGGEGEGLILLAEGRLELSSKRRSETSEVGAGTALGALSLLIVGPREATASTLESCELWLLRREQFRRLIEDNPRTACRLCEAILEDVGSTLRESLEPLTS